MLDERRHIEPITEVDLQRLCPALPRHIDAQPGFVQAALAEADRLIAALTGHEQSVVRQCILADWIAKDIRNDKLLDFHALVRLARTVAIDAPGSNRYQRLIAQLECDQRCVLAVHVIELCDTAATADLLGWSEQRVDTVYRAALRQLQQRIHPARIEASNQLPTCAGVCLEKAFKSMYTPGANRPQFARVLADVRVRLVSGGHTSSESILDWLGIQLCRRRWPRHCA